MKLGGKRRRGNLGESANKAQMMKIITLPQNRYTKLRE